MLKSLLNKTLVFGIIVLFVGVTISPSFNAASSQRASNNFNNGLVKITVQMCKVDGTEENTVWLTQDKADALDILIDNFKAELDNVETYLGL